MIYSRKLKVEEQRNKKRAIFFIFLTIIFLVVMFFYGIPLFVKLAGFVYDLRKSSEPVEVSDNTPPSPPYFELFPAFTNEERIEIGGNSEPGATITMSLNGKDNEVLSNNEGKFSFSLNLVKGENKISAISKDAAGNESQETDIHTINYD